MKWTATAWKHTIKPHRDWWPKCFHFTQGSQYHFSVSNIMLLWIVVFSYSLPLTAGLPIQKNENDAHFKTGENLSWMLHPSYSPTAARWPLQGNRNNWARDSEEFDNVEDDNQQGERTLKETSFDKTGNVEFLMEVPEPKEKRGLSYLTKYYSEAFLNNFPSKGGVGRKGGSGGSSYVNSSAQSKQDSSNQFFGTSTSHEQGFPSSVRRKLSFYPPLATSTGFMTPWSRGAHSGGRTPTMRLRWGK